MDRKCRKCGESFNREGTGRGQFHYCLRCRTSRPEAQARYQRELRERRREARGPNTCKDCGAEFQAFRSDTPRCEDCRLRRRESVVARSEQAHVQQCIDCGATVVRRSLRCKSCSNKERGLRLWGEANHLWKGGRTTQDGYILVRVKPPGFRGHPYQAEHRLVWEQSHGQPIPKGFVVHHLNGIKTDNRPENLVAMSRHYHHHHPREALRPYETRIAALEEYIRSVGHEPPVGELPEVDEDHSH